MVDFQLDLRYKLSITGMGENNMSAILVPYTRLEWLEQKVTFLIDAANQLLLCQEFEHCCLVLRRINEKASETLSASPFLDPSSGRLRLGMLANHLAEAYPEGTIASIGISVDVKATGRSIPTEKTVNRWFQQAMNQIFGFNRLDKDEIISDHNWTRIRRFRPDINGYSEIEIHKLGMVTIAIGLEKPL